MSIIKPFRKKAINIRHPKIQTLAVSAVFCALTFVATLIALPVGSGNVNPGDTILLLAVWELGGLWSVAAAACGAALADLVGSFAVYAPGTLAVKACAAVAALLCLFAGRRTRIPSFANRLISAVIAEAVMAGGYFLYEAFFLSLGVPAALLNLPFNAIQGGVCAGAALLLDHFLSKIPDRHR